MSYATGRPYAGDMFSSLELPIFDTIAGLPVHILVVHLALVLLPVAAVAALIWTWFSVRRSRRALARGAVSP